MTRRSVIITVVIAIAMLIIGAGLGYGVATTEVKTVTSTKIVTTTAIVPKEAYGSRILLLGTLGQKIAVGPWEITVVNVSEGPCIKVRKHFENEWAYYKAPPGMKIVIATVLFKNAGDYEVNLYYEFRVGLQSSPYSAVYLALPLIVTDSGNVYEYKEYMPELEEVKSPSEAKRIESMCIAIQEELDYDFPTLFHGRFKPGDTDVENMMFILPKDEKPVEMVMMYTPEGNRYRLKSIIVVRLSP
jgi:hypothetical protein